jgi:apolipoprotein N-acyltransferase
VRNLLEIVFVKGNLSGLAFLHLKPFWASLLSLEPLFLVIKNLAGKALYHVSPLEAFLGLSTFLADLSS